MATVMLVSARGQADGILRTDVDPLDIHMVIAELGMFNVTNKHTFAAIFQRDMGAKGDVSRRRKMVADMILSYLGCRHVRGKKQKSK